MADTEKPQAKIEVKIGEVSFAGEGEQDWLAEQLAKVIAAIPAAETLSSHAANPPSPNQDEKEPETGSREFKASLASHLRALGAETVQTKRFLATADWLRRRGNTGELTTAMVTKALADNHQPRLGNPADTLNKNVSKGFCEKTTSGFSSLLKV